MTRFCRLVFASLLTIAFNVGWAADVIVHPSVAQRELSVDAVRLMFAMRTVHWPDGRRVRVFVLPDQHPTHSNFAKRTLGLYPRQLRRVWDRYRFSGSGPAPVQVASVEEMLERVATTPGGIGYVPSGFVSEDVEVVSVK